MGIGFHNCNSFHDGKHLLLQIVAWSCWHLLPCQSWSDSQLSHFCLYVWPSFKSLCLLMEKLEGPQALWVKIQWMAKESQTLPWTNAWVKRLPSTKCADYWVSRLLAIPIHQTGATYPWVVSVSNWISTLTHGIIFTLWKWVAKMFLSITQYVGETGWKSLWHFSTSVHAKTGQ